MKNKIPMLAVGMMTLGAIGSIGMQAFAQSAPANQNAKVQTTQTSNQKEVQDVNENNDTSEKDEVVSATVLAQVKVTEAQARQIALTANPNTTISKFEISDENGKPVYDIELSNKTELKIDAVTGGILKSEIDDNEGDKADTQNEEGENGAETNDGPDQN